MKLVDASFTLAGTRSVSGDGNCLGCENQHMAWLWVDSSEDRLQIGIAVWNR